MLNEGYSITELHDLTGGESQGMESSPEFLPQWPAPGASVACLGNTSEYLPSNACPLIRKTESVHPRQEAGGRRQTAPGRNRDRSCSSASSVAAERHEKV